jgi:type I restriction enzyme, S subunit
VSETDTSRQSRTKGREATKGVIPGRFALSVGIPNLPEPPGWRWTFLTAVAQLESGHTPSRRNSEYWDGGIPWIGIKDAVDNHGQTLLDTYQHVSQLGLENSSARLLPSDTVCLSRTASVGYVVVMGRPMATSQDFVNWVCGPSIAPQYLKHILLAENESLLRFASGTTHQTIYYPEAKAFAVLLPPPAEQTAILSILQPLDEKIQLNRRISETLEAIARSVFQSWFVDFDPVHWIAATRTYALTDPTLLEAFPSAFRNSDLGQCPETWRMGSLGDLVTFENGDRGKNYPQPSDYVPNGVPFINAGHLADGFVQLDSVNQISEDAYARLGGGKTSPGDLLYCLRGSPGRVARVSGLSKGAIASSLVILRGATPGAREYVYYFLSSAAGKKLVNELDNGSAQPNISARSLAGYPVLVPPPAVLEKFDTWTRPLWAALERQLSQTRAIEELRRYLLPRLLSRELSVREAERQASKVA